MGAAEYWESCGGLCRFFSSWTSNNDNDNDIIIIIVIIILRGGSYITLLCRKHPELCSDKLSDYLMWSLVFMT